MVKLCDTVYSTSEYRSNVNYLVGIEGYRSRRRSLRHTRLVGHVEQTRYVAIDKYSRLGY